MMKSSFKMIILFFAVILIGISATVSYYYIFNVIEVKVIPYDFSGSNVKEAAYNLDKDKFHFGTVPIGYKMRREIEIANTNDFSVLVRIEVDGEGRDMISFEENRFYLEAKESKTINVFAIPNREGFFEGEITVKMAKK